MAFWSRFFGSAGSQAAGVAFGVAAVPSLIPAAQFLENEAWSLHPDKPPDAVLLAQGVAQGQVDPDSAAEWAKQQGFGTPQWTALVDVANVGPGASYAFELWRRNVIDEAGFRRALKRLGLEAEWIDDLTQIKAVLLSVAELANAVVQGHMSMTDATAEAEKQGTSADRFAVLVANTGLPPGPETGLAWLRRGILDTAEFGDLVREGHTKTKYIPKYLAALDRIISVTQAVDAHVRGWITEQEMYQRAALDGFAQPEVDLLFKIHGRPLSWHQIFIGLRRGGVYDGPVGDLDPAFLKGLRESDIRPEWYNLAWAQRYNYPTAFVLRNLTESGDITEADAHEILLFEGWEPGLAQKVAAKWATPAGAKADPWIAKSDNQLWTALHKAYVGGLDDPAKVAAAFDLIGVAAAAQTAVLERWDAEKGL